jgi:hypothetical protein
MNRLFRLLVAGILAAGCAAFAQTATCNTATPAICTKGSPSGDVQIKPQSVPTSATTVTSYDAYLKTVTIANTTGSAVTFTLADRQASPVAALSAVSIGANTTYVVTFPNLYWCPGGFTVTAGASGLNFYASWRQ